jgi:hypothetical protein
MKSLKSVLVAAFAVLLVVAPARLVLADAGGETGHSFDATFTKWVTSPGTPPVLLNMVGVVGGDVGEGTYTGEVLSMETVGNITTIVPLYHFNGSRHSFTALLTVKQDNTTGTAEITGVVTEGWQLGAPVTGEFTVMDPCPIPTPGNMLGTVCFQGALHVHRGPQD